MRFISVAAALVGVGLVVSCSSGQSGESGETAKPSSESKPSAQPKFDGLYEVKTDLSKRKVNFAPAPSEENKPFKLAVRSACAGDNDCTATGLTVGDDGKEVPGTGPLVFDLVDGHWLSVQEVTDGSCQLNPDLRKVDAPYFSIWNVEAKDDGPMSGQGLYIGANECMNISDAPATFTRTGDAPADLSLPDPASQPKRVTSPAAGLRGKYSGPVVTADQPDWKYSQVWDAHTLCLRTGAKCLTTVAATQTDENQPGSTTAFPSDYIFENGRWTGGAGTGPIDCAEGAGRTTKSITGTFGLPPEPVPDPITTVTVDQATTVGDPCASTLNSQITLNRVGD
jgi:serine/threonine-protein kinase